MKTRFKEYVGAVCILLGFICGGGLIGTMEYADLAGLADPTFLELLPTIIATVLFTVVGLVLAHEKK